MFVQIPSSDTQLSCFKAAGFSLRKTGSRKNLSTNAPMQNSDPAVFNQLLKRNSLPFASSRLKISQRAADIKKMRAELGRYYQVALDGISDAQGFSLYVERSSRAVLMVDLVESVRLIEADEKGTITRWLGFVHYIENEILPNHNGRLIKVLGDGFLADFDTVKDAGAVAFKIQQFAGDQNASVSNPDRHFLLRMGMEIADVYDDERDIYGHGVNLAARLMTLAGPGEIIISADARDHLTSDLDADLEDLGECFVKHVAEPIRAYRMGAAGNKPIVEATAPVDDLLATIAVLPFSSRMPSRDQQVLGDVLAEELIRSLSVSQHLNVISRLSTSAFRGIEADFDKIATHLKAQFVLSGSYFVDSGNITLTVELADVKSRKVLWSDRFSDRLEAIFTAEQDLINQIISDVSKAIMSRQVQRCRVQSLPTLETYSLLMASVSLMHRLSPRDFELARKMLDIIVERIPRQAIAHAWIANWHVLRLQQGWTENPDRDIAQALDRTKRSLDADPDGSLAHAISGLVQTHMSKDLDGAMKSYELAVSTNPNNSLAWLLKGTLHAFIGNGSQAVSDTLHAQSLSPLDPHRYYYDSLTATAYNANGEYEKSLEISSRSLRENCNHASTLRTMAVSQWYLGQHDNARNSVKALLKLEPSLTVTEWLKMSPTAEYETGKNWSYALGQAGLPE